MRNHFWAAVFLFAAAGVSLRAQPLTTLHSFDGADGVSPNTGVIQGTDGNLYGSTASGGANGNGGTLFHITPAGVLTTFYSFCAQSGCTDGNSPDGLVQAANGDFYGATSAGGNQNCGNTAGCGTIFKITSAGALTTLYSFCSQGGSACTDGYAPYAPLLKASNGNFYGTTASGGAANCYDGCGTIFKITPAGVLTTLHTFCAETGCLDGYDSEGLIQATNAQFYGTTFGGCTANGCGGTFSG